MNSEVDKYLINGCMRCPLGATPECKVNDWIEELKLMRQILLETELTEELKWSAPCYTFDGNNVLMLSALKDSTVVSFFKGSLMKDPHGILTAPGKNSQAARYVKVTSIQQIHELEESIKAYVKEAIEIEKADLKVEFKQNPEPIPEELQWKLDKDPIFKNAFESLTPGRQRGYIIHFSQPKQSKTRESRIEKCIPNILNGIGMHDHYKSKKK
ncbi:MAG: YdeI/OmpD-associated family protein [Balneolaceae bacterium]